MAKYRKKPVVIDAIQWTGENHAEIEAFMGYGGYKWSSIHPDAHLIIFTLEGDHRAITGSWIVKGIKGEFYPCKPDIFAATYELVEESGE